MHINIFLLTRSGWGFLWRLARTRIYSGNPAKPWLWPGHGTPLSSTNFFLHLPNFKYKLYSKFINLNCPFCKMYHIVGMNIVKILLLMFNLVQNTLPIMMFFLGHIKIGSIELYIRRFFVDACIIKRLVYHVVCFMSFIGDNMINKTAHLFAFININTYLCHQP